jgi:hypothetical protein
MFGILENLTKAAVGIATTPVAIVADVLTCNGIATDQKEAYTEAHLKRIMRNFEEAVK